MSKQPTHSKLLTAAAREHLKPLGLIQKGRSRTWLDDQRWYVTVVEFQPSSWSKGSYLNVGVNWLWYPKDYYSFDLGYRVKQFHEYESDNQFTLSAGRLAEEAVKQVQKYRRHLLTLESARNYWCDQVIERSDDPWVLFHSGVLAGLVGKMDGAKKCFESVLAEETEYEWEIERHRVIEELSGTLGDPKRFRGKVVEHIMTSRRLKKLELIETKIFP